MSFIQNSFVFKVLLYYLGVRVVSSSAWPLLVFHLDKPFLRGRWWSFPAEEYNSQHCCLMCQLGFTLHSDINQTVKAVFSLKKDFHLLEGLQSWRKLIEQPSQ